MRPLRLIMILAWCVFCATPMGKATAESTFRIGAIHDTSIIGGCGCTAGQIFFADTSCRAWININGEDIELHAKGRGSGG